MAASTDLTTLANAKEYLGISGSDDDTLLGNLIDRASEAIENYCRRKFAQETLTEYYDGRGSHRLVLNRRPVSSITSIYDDLDRDFTEDTLIDADDYVLYPDEGIVEFKNTASTFPSTAAYFYDGQRNVKVTYVAGYETIPTDVEQACLMLVALLYNRAKQRADGIKQESQAGAYSVAYAGMLMTPEIKALLEPYREYRI